MFNRNDDDRSTSDPSGDAFDDSEAATLLEAATTFWRDLGDLKGARRYFDQLRELAPDHPDVIEFYRGLDAERARDAARARAAWRELDSIPNDRPEERLVVLERLLTLYREQVDDRYLRLRACREILALNRGHRGAFEAIAGQLEAEERWFDLAAVIGDRVAVDNDPARRLELLRREAELALARTGRLDRAVRALEAVLEIEPGDPAAVAGLEEVHRRRRSWRALLGLLEDRAEPLEGVSRVDALVEAAELAAGRAADPERAQRLWRLVLELDPSRGAALEALSRIAEQRGEWGALVEITRARIGRAGDEDRRIALLVSLGRTLYARRGDPTGAIEPLERVLATRPTHPEARRILTEIYLTTARWQALEDIYVRTDDVGLLVQLLARRLDDTEDPATRLTIALRCAELLRVQIGHADRAVSFYELALELDPRNRQAAAQLAPVYLRRRDWERLIGVIEAMPEGTDVVELLPRRSEALLSMERAALLGQKWGAMISVLKRRRDDPASAEQWQELTHQIGVILEDKLASKRQALEAYGELLLRNPGDPDYLAALAHHLDGDHREQAARILEPHAERAEDWALLARALAILAEASDGVEQRAELCLRLARVRQERLEDPAGAYEALTGALAARPDDPELWERLERLARAVDRLEDLSEKLGEAYWGGGLGPERRADLAARLVDLLDTSLGLRDRAEVYHWQLLRAGRDDGSSLAALEQLFREEGGRQGDLLDLYDLAIEAAGDHTRRLDLRRRACLAADELGDPERAIGVYRALREEAPEDGRAAERLEELYTRTERFRDLYRLLESRLDGAMPFEAAAYRFKLADISQQRLGRLDLAVEWCARLLEDDPEHEEGLAVIERLSRHPALSRPAARRVAGVYAKRGDAAMVARMLERQLEDRGATVDERVRLASDLASVRERALGDPRGAALALLAVLEIQPGHRAARQALARLAPAQGLGARYAELLAGAVESAAGDADLQVELLLELARVEAEALARPERAEAALGRALGIQTSDSSLETRTEIVLRLARVAGEGTGDIDRLIGYLRELHDRGSNDTRVLGELERLYERSGRILELIDVLRRHSSLETDPAARRALILKMSDLAGRMQGRR